MPAPVVVKFATAGAKEVEAVFASLTKKMQTFGRAQAASAARAAQASTKATTTSATQMDKIRERTAMMAGQHAKRAAKSEEMAAKQSAKVVAAEAKRVDRIRERSATMAGNYAKKAADAELREARRYAKGVVAAERAAVAERAKLGRARGAAIGSAAMGGARRAYGTATGAAGMLGAGVGLAAIGSGVSSAYQLNKRAAMLSINTQMPGAAAISPQDLVGAARGAATETGSSAESILASMETVTAKGGGVSGLKAYMQDMRELTKLSATYGVEMEDMGSVVAAALNSGVKPGDDMIGMVRSLIVQGQAGSIEFKDFADELARLGGAGNKFGSGARMLQDVGGLAQISAVTSGGNVAGARTTVIDMLREFTMGPKIAMLSEMGVSTTANGYTRNPQDLMAETINAIESGATPKKIPGLSTAQQKGMSPDALKAALYSSMFTGRSADIQSTLTKTYREGYTAEYGPNAGKKYTGAEAVRARIESSSRPYELTAEKAAANYEEISKTLELARAHENFKQKMGELLPELTKLIPVLINVADKFARLAVWVGQNPFTGLGAFVMAMMGKELASAAIGKVVEGAFMKFGTAMSGGGSALGKAGAIGTIALTAAAVYLTGTKIIDEAVDKFSDVQTKLKTETYGAQGVLDNPNATLEQKKKALAELKASRASAAKEGVGAIVGMAGSTAAFLTGDESMDPEKMAAKNDIAAQQLTAQLEASIAVQESIAKSNAAVVAALDNAATKFAAGGGTLASPGAGPRTTPASRAGL